MGGLGLKLAEWLIFQGAQFLVLAGRKAPEGIVLAKLEELKKLGHAKYPKSSEAKIETMQIDLAHQPSVAELLGKFGKGWPELKGIIHSAGVIDDGTLLSQEWARFEKVLAPKMIGGWNLHLASLDKPLDFFVLFSSVASILGSPGQSNYAAANAFLDGLADYRFCLDLPALSISWGPWGEVGMAAQLTHRHMESGLTPFTPEEGIRGLEFALKQHVSHLLLAKIDWEKYLKKLPKELNWIDALRPRQPKKTENPPLLEQLKLTPPNQQVALLEAHVRLVVKKILGLSTSQVLNDSQGFFESGMDSLMAVELKNQLQADIGHGYPLPPTLVFDNPTIRDLVKYLKAILLQREC
jgi:myxalamid-type polyketide synthase MxaB